MIVEGRTDFASKDFSIFFPSLEILWKVWNNKGQSELEHLLLSLQWKVLELLKYAPWLANSHDWEIQGMLCYKASLLYVQYSVFSQSLAFQEEVKYISLSRSCYWPVTPKQLLLQDCYRRPALHLILSPYILQWAVEKKGVITNRKWLPFHAQEQILFQQRSNCRAMMLIKCTVKSLWRNCNVLVQSNAIHFHFI